MNFLKEHLDKITGEDKILLDVWRKTIFNNKGDTTICGRYQGIANGHSMKQYEERNESVKSNAIRKCYDAICPAATCHRIQISGKDPAERRRHECRSEQEHTLWVEQLEEDVRRPTRQDHNTKGKIHNNYDCSAVWDEDNATTSSHAKKLEMTETKMCRWACDLTPRDRAYM